MRMNVPSGFWVTRWEKCEPMPMAPMKIPMEMENWVTLLPKRYEETVAMSSS